MPYTFSGHNADSLSSVCIAGGLRGWRIHAYFSSPDIFYEWPAIYVASAVEFWVAIMTACGPYVKPWLIMLFPRAFGVVVPDSAKPKKKKRTKHLFRRSLNGLAEDRTATWVMEAYHEEQLAHPNSIYTINEDVEKSGSTILPLQRSKSKEAFHTRVDSFDHPMTSPRLEDSALDRYQFPFTDKAELVPGMERVPMPEPPPPASLASIFSAKYNFSMPSRGVSLSRRTSSSNNAHAQTQAEAEAKMQEEKARQALSNGLFNGTEIAMPRMTSSTFYIQPGESREGSLWVVDPRDSSPTQEDGLDGSGDADQRRLPRRLSSRASDDSTARLTA